VVFFNQWCVYYWWHVGGYLVVDDVIWQVYYFHNSVLKILIGLLLKNMLK